MHGCCYLIHGAFTRYRYSADGGHVLLTSSRGIVNAFGEYQTYYESGELFHATSLQISWIGSVQAFMLLFVGAITGYVHSVLHFPLQQKN